MHTLPEHVLLIDKPKGITSFDVIRILRKKRNIKKMGHAGTLDPLASGLMLIGVGEGTKLLAEYLKLPKEYVAHIRIGERRSTGDLAGTIVEEKQVSGLERDAVSLVLDSMRGTLRLPVSAYSAIKKGGVPMYKRARKAEVTGDVITDLPVRDMVVNDVELQAFTCAGGRCVATVRFAVESGTYIRSLAEELGRRLGYPATLQDLRRTKIGIFDIKDSEQLD